MHPANSILEVFISKQISSIDEGNIVNVETTV